MMIYTECDNQEQRPTATVHNLDTGITYVLEVNIYEWNGERVPQVRYFGPGFSGGVLFDRQQAEEFWRKLLSAARLSPMAEQWKAEAFMNTLLGRPAPDANGKPDNEFPF